MYSEENDWENEDKEEEVFIDDSDFNALKYPNIKENFVSDPTLKERLSRNVASIFNANLALYHEEGEPNDILIHAMDTAMDIEELLYARINKFKT